MQATAEFPVGCLATANALVTNASVSNFIITNGGFGYVSPSVGLVGSASIVAAIPTARIALYNLNYNFQTPATANVSNTQGAEIPSNGKLNNLALASLALELLLQPTLNVMVHLH